MKTIKLPLTGAEKARIKAQKLKPLQLLDFATDEIEVLLEVPLERAIELKALVEFQTLDSVGIRFAQDLVFLGYFSVSELHGKTGWELTDAYEEKIGYWVDPCVEDQFRLIAHVANTGDRSKKWWDFTEERKKFRQENGYPKSRPQNAWHDTLEKLKKAKKDEV